VASRGPSATVKSHFSVNYVCTVRPSKNACPVASNLPVRRTCYHGPLS